MTTKKTIILVVILVIGFLGSYSASFFLGSFSKKAADSPSTSTDISTVKCQPGLLAPTVDSRACSFKDIAAAEIERRKLCNKEDARAALEVACKDNFKLPANFAVSPSPSLSSTSPIVSTTQTPTPPSAPQQEIPQTSSPSGTASNCNSKALSSSERFIQNKSLACGQFMDLAATEFFNNPKSGCKSKDEALKIVKETCTGGAKSATGSATLTPSANTLNSLSNLITCQTIAASVGDLVKKQPTVCSSASIVPTEYASCSKEIIEVATPICLGLGQGKPTTTLTGATSGNNSGQPQLSSTDCKAASDAIQTDPKVCQFKDVSAQELANRGLCNKDAAKDVLNRSCPANNQTPISNTNTGQSEKVCNGALVAADSEFQTNKSLACSVGKSVAIQRIMARAGSPCKTETQASQALNDACSGNTGGTSGSSGAAGNTGSGSSSSSGGGSGSTNAGSSGASTQNNSNLDCSKIADDLASIVKNNRDLCSTAQTIPSEYQSCSRDISNKVALTCANSGSNSPSSSTLTCQGSLVVQNSRFQQNKALACSSASAKTSAIEIIKTTPGSPCKTDSQAAQALEEACQLSGLASGGTQQPTTSQNTSGNQTQPGSNECQAYAESLYSTVSKNTSLCSSNIPDQFKSCTDLILSTLAPICQKNTAPSSQAKCDGATVSKDSQFKQSRDLACGSGKSVAEQTIASRSDSPCKGDIEASRKALEEACTLTATGSTAPTANQPTTPTSNTNAGQSEKVCNGALVNADSEFQSNKNLACTDYKSVAIQKIMNRANSPCKTEAQASQALNEACGNSSSGGTNPTTSNNQTSPNQNSNTNQQNNSNLLSNNSSNSNSLNNPPSSSSSKCTCSAIAANAEFQQNSSLACANQSIAAGQIASKSNGNCTTSEAATELAKICGGSCSDSSGNAVAAPEGGSSNSNVPLYKIGNEPSILAGGDGGGSTSKCTCTAIAANPEFQQNSGLACQYKSTAVDRIVAGSGGNCDSGTAGAELDKICAGSCTDSMGQAIAAPQGGGGIMGSFLNTIKSIPFIGSLASMFGGGDSGGGSGGGGFTDMIGGLLGGGGGGGFDIPVIGDLLGGGGGDGGFDIPVIGDILGGGGGGDGGGGFDFGGIIQAVGGFLGGFF